MVAILKKALLVCALVAVLTGTSIALAHHNAFTGRSVYYSNVYAGQQMACGPNYQPWKMVAAHRTLPCGTRLRVKNRANGRVVTLTVQDRGPYNYDFVLDVSRRAARKLRFIRAGTARIRAVILHD